MPTIWRLNIKTASEDNVDPRQFCINLKILGVGWAVDNLDNNDWDTYYKLAEEEYYNKGDKGWWPAVNALKNRMQLNDLCWTRDWSGVYYIGRIKSDWRYEAGDQYRSADVVNIRDCDWKTVGEVDAVPGKVINSFIPSRTVQAVYDESVEIYSAFLYNSLSDDYIYPLKSISTDLLSLISSEDCEDIVGLFLQEKGYRIIPSSCKADTAAYEFVMKHVSSGKSAVAQVKQGFVDIDMTAYSCLPSEVFLFTTHGQYIGTPAENIICLSPHEICDFIKNHHAILSDRIKRWISITEQLGKDKIA
ncbi:MAG: hypothetical protein KBG04_08020 [Bacteroidales bacterium]|nr:hypothetical protein [Bacteroidales bacterium]